jgi:hypothetical protein
MRKVKEFFTYGLMLGSLIVASLRTIRDNGDTFTDSAKSGPKVFV